MVRVGWEIVKDEQGNEGRGSCLFIPFLSIQTKRSAVQISPNTHFTRSPFPSRPDSTFYNLSVAFFFSIFINIFRVSARVSTTP